MVKKTHFICGQYSICFVALKSSKYSFPQKNTFKKVDSRQIKIPYYRSFGQQRGRGFGALANVIGRTTVLLLRNNFVAASKRIGADLLDFAAPENAEVIGGR